LILKGQLVSLNQSCRRGAPKRQSFIL
jgi:hypothetical protein